MIICFSGFKNSGKDTCAAYLIEKYGAVRVALADPLKDSVAEEFGIDRASLDDPKRKEGPLLHLPVDPKDGFSKMIAEFLYKEFAFADNKKPSNRFFYFGDSFRGDRIDGGNTELYWTPRALAILKGSTNRSIRSDYWTNKTFEKSEKLLKEDPNKLIVVTDVRYKSEVAQFKERFGDGVVFVRIDRHRESPSQDPSERDLDSHEFDYRVDNSESLKHTHVLLANILADLTLKRFK